MDLFTKRLLRDTFGTAAETVARHVAGNPEALITLTPHVLAAVKGGVPFRIVRLSCAAAGLILAEGRGNPECRATNASRQ